MQSIIDMTVVILLVVFFEKSYSFQERSICFLEIPLPPAQSSKKGFS